MHRKMRIFNVLSTFYVVTFATDVDFSITIPSNEGSNERFSSYRSDLTEDDNEKDECKESKVDEGTTLSALKL